ncbi:hypothetical protein ACSBR1_021277 [Camellia fascicularis]
MFMKSHPVSTHNRTSKWLVPELENAIASRNLYEASVQLQYPEKIWAVALVMVQDKSKLPWEVFSSQALLTTASTIP